MRLNCLLVVTAALGATVLVDQRVAFGQVHAELRSVGGGAAMQGSAPDLYQRPTTSATFYIFIIDGSTPVPNLTFTAQGMAAYPNEGGHNHNGWGWGIFTPSSGTTGPAGEGAAFTYNAGPASGLVWFFLEFTYAGYFYTLSPVNGIRVGEEPTAYPRFTGGNFILVGETATHSDNHHAQGWFISFCVQLAQDYGNTWGLNLAYNDASLPWGGVFDLNSDYAAPHAEHNIGLSLDVRANGGLSSIPFDGQIRQWFEQRVLELFGRPPLHEFIGTSNEHYHIFG